ncbi:hypothetical protein [Sphingobium sp. CFD-1]|uniref:hypothetical protein n=1 Tax=Sphingobium sp. CFD-1 TaxID=2878545 RepID=UPI00214B8AFC|nr:hypothetical protein [Sphingobium sp. CFD-1]
MALLNGGIASIFGAALGGLYLPGTLNYAGVPVEDIEGNVTGHTGGGSWPCRAQVDGATWAMRQSAGYVDGDVRIIVLSAGLPVAINTDMTITVSSKEWMIEAVEKDAAASHWILRGRAA